MKIMKAIVCACSLFVSAAHAGEDAEIRTLGEDGVSPPASIEQLDWLVGSWSGEGLGGTSADVIAPAAGGQMMGMFRHLKEDGSVNFYEFYVFAETGDTLTLRLKHFSPDLVGWEEKDKFVEFPLVAVEDDAVYFDGLTFARTGLDEMQAAVKISEQGIARFNQRRDQAD